MPQNLDSDLQFALQITGHTLAEGPADPDSPLGRLLALAAEHGEESLTEEHFSAAMRGAL
ncbi:hypothetical protein ABZ348_31045 [Streptomyces sp. NPDC005963]|uniref:hypothetical protein n=1 Tax=Streptomyces sp. NPDC005963 TaxID=3156721 RepID=UPI0033DF752E